MNPDRLFHPSYDSGPASRLAIWILIAALAFLAFLAYLGLYLDHPFLIATNSRALYVDEGFYSDAAQNFAKFGRWGFPFDFSQWVGAPFLTFIQSLVFPVFGPSLETARLLSTAFGLGAGFAFYGMVRLSMRPAAALMLTLSGMLTLNYVVHARSALVEPTAVCVALLALLTFARVRNRSIAIPLSIALASAAFLSKMYFLFTLGAVAGLWVLELVLVPALTRKPFETKPVVILIASLAAVTAFYALYSHLFGERIADYYFINKDKAPMLDFEFVVNSLAGSLSLLPYNTKTHIPLLIIALAPLAVTGLLLMPGMRGHILTRFRNFGRVELALGLWLAMGLVTIGVLNSPKPHYHFFAILPLCFVGAAVLKLVLPYSLHTIAIGAAATLHLIFQLPLYYEWSRMAQHTALVDSSRDVARIVERESDEQMIPVNGEYSAELGLFSERVFSLDVKWAPAYHYCRRIEHWKPRFHVNIVWPGSASRTERKAIENCEVVADTDEIKRYSLFKPREDELVLSRIRYK